MLNAGRPQSVFRNINQNKKERYSRVPRLSDTPYSAIGTKGKWRYTSSKARLKCATYTQKKIKYFVLEPSIFGVKTSPSMENTELENKILLSSTNFQGPKYSI